MRSSQVLVPLLADLLDIGSVLDVGCGRGAWLKTWRDGGVEVFGVDGDYVDRDSLLIPKECFKAVDLRQPFNLGRTFSFVQCLEVAEHLPEDKAQVLVNSLCAHSELVLFSAATPGQGGENHLNEQSYSYWQNLFSQRGYIMFDPIRGKILFNPLVDDWYKYNIFLYVKSDLANYLEESLHLSRVVRPKDVSPIVYRLRKVLIRVLPVKITTFLAKAKKHLFLAKVYMLGLKR